MKLFKLDLMRIILRNARIVTPFEDFMGYLVIENGLITDIQKNFSFSEGEDLNGNWLIPGCIDIHSDYWEKEIHPRPGANFPLDMAFHFMDQRAAACGLTTVFSAISFSDNEEKGRTFEMAIEKSRSLGVFTQNSLVRHFVHARLNPNTDGVLNVLEEIRNLDALKLVVYNEDIPGQRQFTLEHAIEERAKKKREPLEVARKEIEIIIEKFSKINHRGIIQKMLGEKMILGSHDDTTVEHVEEAKHFGSLLCEMPTTLEAARRAKELNMWVCMGAPNLVRGGSHCGNLSSIDAMKEGLVDMFCSDYHFPTMLTGMLKMISMGIAPSHATNLMALNPAKLLGTDQELGSIEIGKKADLVSFSNPSGFAKIEGLWIEGRKKMAISNDA